ncbi:transglycosylase domain-containing protein [Anoxynatronum buryatiense]|uniref:Penicillin-binding protein 1A n=1 Tax=Anoxynatronum buryatiense TaxID=489973 RepID=A0AA45WVS7_9CLOT|nr:transglycosylase domain-containing protein [Anoxynatronum buryatiense]SMP49903.1 penicillin-binding protein 1A [Anoxynatronum buryatiense]
MNRESHTTSNRTRASQSSGSSTASTVRRRKKKNSAGKVIFWTLLISIFLVLFLAAGTALGIVAGIVKEIEPIDASNIYSFLDESSFILDEDGHVLEKVQTEGYRSLVDYQEIPDHLINAFVAIEDERFWSHNGIDIKRIFGAFWANFRTGSMQGASTINQQLAKIIYLSPEQTYTRKIKDAYYGMQLDSQLSKEQILEAYLNTINLGSVAYSGSYSVQANGIQAAAELYFSKDLGELTHAEAALLAGIARNPPRYSPVSTLRKENVRDTHVVYNDSDAEYTVVFNPETLPRMRLVLSSMRRLNYLTESEYQAALNQDISASINLNRLTNDEISSYFGDLVQRDVINELEKIGYTRSEARQMVQSGGLAIHSTLNMRMQRILEEEFSKAENFPGTLRDSEGNYILDEEGNVQPQSAMVIIDDNTGHIKALIGGRMSDGQKIFNRALSPRQPGSAMKPLAAYTAALDLGLTAGTVVDDIPTYLNIHAPNTPWPRNHYTSIGYYGLMTMREAMRVSSNVAAVRFAEMLGQYDDRPPAKIMFDYMERMGITSLVHGNDPVISNGQAFHDENYSMVLGGMTKGVSPLEMTNAFAVFANQGIYTEPVTFTKVYDRRGNLILDKKPERSRVLSEQAAFIMTDLLRDAVSSGTGSRARIDQGNSQIPVAGKTGTTSDQKDAWFVGYTPYYTAGVWIGHDLPEKLSEGSRMAAELWKTVMVRVHEDHAPKSFEQPDGLVRVNICSKSGKLPTELCALDPRGSTVRSELFVQGTQPTEYCEVHVQADIHVPSGKLATEMTPPWEVETRIFTKRSEPYIPEEHNGIVPQDFPYELPLAEYDPFIDGSGSYIPFDPGNSWNWDPNDTQDNNTPSNESPTDSNYISKTLRIGPLSFEGTAQLSLYRVHDGRRTLLEVRTHQIDRDGDHWEVRIVGTPGSGLSQYEVEINGTVRYQQSVEF